MKKILAFLTVCVIAASSLGVTAFADETVTGAPEDTAAVVDVQEGEAADASYVTVMINGTELQPDVPAQIIGDRTMVPMRAIFEKLGANVTWIPENQSIFATQGPTLIVMRIGVNTLAVSTIGADSKSVELDVPPQIVNDRTLVPARAISEALGCTVDWDEATRTVTITK